MSESGAPYAAVDRALVALGLEGQDGLARKTWRGRFDGREVVVYLAPQSRTRYYGEVRVRQRQGYRLRADMATGVPVRAFFVKASFSDGAIVRWLYRLRRQTVVESVPSALEGFRVVVPKQVAWVERFLAQGEAVAAAARLLKDEGRSPLAGSVYFSPGHLHYASPLLGAADLTGERAQAALEQLTVVARGAERTGPPEQAEAPSRLERLSKERPYVAAFAVLGGILAVLSAGAMVLIGLAVALAALLAGG